MIATAFSMRQRKCFGANDDIAVMRTSSVPHPRSGGGEPPKAVEGASDKRSREARPLHHASHGPPPPSLCDGGGARARMSPSCCALRDRNGLAGHTVSGRGAKLQHRLGHFAWLDQAAAG